MNKKKGGGGGAVGLDRYLLDLVRFVIMFWIEAGWMISAFDCFRLFLSVMLFFLFCPILGQFDVSPGLGLVRLSYLFR